MGMDVYGRKPTSEAGKYFRASIWEWGPLHSLMVELCSDVVDATLLSRMRHNDGAGPEDQETCDRIADRINMWLEDHALGIEMHEKQLSGVPWAELFSNALGCDVSPRYSIDDDHLKEWVAFLRDCGGFQVY